MSGAAGDAAGSAKSAAGDAQGGAKSSTGDVSQAAKSAAGDAKGAAQGAGRQLQQATPDLSANPFDDIAGKVQAVTIPSYPINTWNTQFQQQSHSSRVVSGQGKCCTSKLETVLQHISTPLKVFLHVVDKRSSRRCCWLCQVSSW